MNATLSPGSSVLVLTGGIGAGHDRAAAEIQRRLVANGHRADVIDVLDVMGWHLGHLVRWAYFTQLRTVPSTWGVLLSALGPDSRQERLARWALARAGRGVARETSGYDLVIATHPFASIALGELRARGRLDIPALTYLTDASAHALWVHPGIDLHLTWHPDAAAEVRAYGGRVELIQPLLPEPRPRTLHPTLTRQGGLPTVLITGGSQGVGELEEAAYDVLATGLGHPVVLCGHNDALVRKLARDPRITALGWREDAAQLIADADCVVQNAGGFTCLEAMANRTPVITYREIPGHGHSNSAALDSAGLVPWARSRAELAAHLAAALARPTGDTSAWERTPDLLGLLQPVVLVA